MAKKNRETNSAPKSNRPEIPFKERPFAGYVIEEKLVAAREFLPVATMELALKAKGETVIVCTALPQMVGAWVREDGAKLVAMQARSRTSDASHDLSLAISKVLQASADGIKGRVDYDIMDESQPLEDLLDPKTDAQLVIHDSFDFWFTPAELEDPQLQESISSAASEVTATYQVPGVAGAYLADMGKHFVRWIRTDGERETLDALARIHARREATLGDETKLLGAFRVLGVLVPVWEVPSGTKAEDLSAPIKKVDEAFALALADDSPLDSNARRAKAGLINRQVVIR